MSKKDYRLIAGALRYSGVVGSPLTEPAALLVDTLCGIFKRDNPRFDQERFEDAVYTGKGAAAIERF